MILDLDKFIAKERFYWDELAALLERQDAQPDRRQSLEEAKPTPICSVYSPDARRR